MRNKKDHTAKRMFGPGLLILTGAVLFAAGIYRGEMDVVLRKAVNICLECIGIG